MNTMIAFSFRTTRDLELIQVLLTIGLCHYSSTLLVPTLSVYQAVLLLAVLMQTSTVGLVLAPTLLHLTLRIGRIIEYRPGSALSLSLSYARYDILYILLVYGGLTLPLM